MQIIVRVQGAEEAERKISALRGNLGGMMALIAVLVQRQTEMRIRSEKTAPDGTPWAGWSKSYGSSKGARGRGLLVRTGRLMGSIMASNTDTQAIIGTNVEYAPFLQLGTKKMPARPFLGVSKANGTEIETAMENYIKRLL